MNLNLKVLLLAVVVVAAVSTVAFGARQDEAECVPKPPSEFGAAMFTQGIGFLAEGGLGAILWLIIAFILGMVISHLLWGGL